MPSIAKRIAKKLVAEIIDNAPHVIVQAKAGSGKTTTIIEGLKCLLGHPVTIKPSPQQQAVWEAMSLSKGTAKSICFVAFNKSIATELQNRVPQGVEAMTMHSMGLRAITKTLGRFEINNFVVQDIIADLLKTNTKDLRKNKPTLLSTTDDLVGLCKMNLLEGTIDECISLCNHHNIELNGSASEVYDLVPKVLERCKDPKANGNKINFDDMIWLPVILNLPITKYDLLLVDEVQDLNTCQQQLAIRAGKRLILVGDVRQAIYGFAGADAESMKNLSVQLSNICQETDTRLPTRGCIEIPLTVTRRCGKRIVAEANHFVADFQAHETCCEGSVSSANYPIRKVGERTEELPYEQTYLPLVQDGDMVLCRTNAPLVNQCFKFLRLGRKANIQGRDIGKGLIALVKKTKAETVRDLLERLADWLSSETTKEQCKSNPCETRIQGFQDRYDCLCCFCSDLATSASVEKIIAKIESVFTDDKQNPGIKFSSIHKAKGLESRRVFFLKPPMSGPRRDKMRDWEIEQEDNLSYVAITRAIEELIYVR